MKHMQWMKQHLSFFQMEEASTCTMNDSTSKICEIEEASIGPDILKADAHSKLLPLPLPKGAMSRKCIASINME